MIATSQALIDYLHFDLARAGVEHLRILYLDVTNRLLAEHDFAGSVSEASASPREIMRRALDVDATAIIMVHNHPSGDPRPSTSDIETTRRIADVGRTLGITLHDHIVIARAGFTSLRAAGLL